MKLTLSLIFLAALAAKSDARSIILSQKDLQAVGSVIKSVLDHHLSLKESRKIHGTFTLDENEDDYDITMDVDISTSETNNGVLSGEDG